VNGKVLEFIGDRGSFQGILVCKFMMGKMYEVAISKILFDPLYGWHDHLHEFSREHCACLEDSFFSNMGKQEGYFKVVALLEQPYAD
jgi:hypothetical protein